MRIIRTAQFVSGKKIVLGGHISMEEYDKYSDETTHFHITMSDNSFMSFGVHDSAADDFVRQVSQFLENLEGRGQWGAAGTEVNFVHHVKGPDGGSVSESIYHGFIQKEDDTFGNIGQISRGIARKLNPSWYNSIDDEIERQEAEKEERKSWYMDQDEPLPMMSDSWEDEPTYLDPDHAQKTSPGGSGGLGGHPSLGKGLNFASDKKVTKKAEEYDEIRDYALERGMNWRDPRVRRDLGHEYDRRGGLYPKRQPYGPKPSTSKQMLFIKNLLKKLGRENEFEQINLSNPSSSEASSLISKLKRELGLN